MPGNFQVHSQGILTLIPSSENTSWSLKTSLRKKNSPINSKNIMNIFQAQGFPWFWDFLLGYPKTMKIRDLQESFK
jgi:hypothetical protein